MGAGPAGAWAAFRLAASGARVAIIDGSHPREKPCGGGLSGRALRTLASPAHGPPPDTVEMAEARFTAADAVGVVPLGRTAGDRPALLIASRREFDAHLLERARGAGAEHVPRRVTGFARSNGGWTVETGGPTLNAAWLLGADGANSLVRRRLFRPFLRSELSIASGYFVAGRSGTHIDIEFTDAPAGYLWSFPRRDHLAVGICAQGDETGSRHLFACADAWIKRRVGAGAAATRYSWPIPSLSVRALQEQGISGDGWLLLGDAAGLVDPVTREGIFFALASGEIAARSLAGRHASSMYRRRVGRMIYDELTRAARVKARFFSPAFTTLLVRAVGQSGGVAAIMAGLISGEQTYRGLRRRLLRTGELRLALEYLQLSRRK